MVAWDLLGMPDTSLSGLKTLTARRVRKSKSEPTVDRILQGKRQTHRNVHSESIFKPAGLVTVSQPLSFSLSLTHNPMPGHYKWVGERCM